MMIHGACDVHTIGLHFVAILGYAEGEEQEIILDLGDMDERDLWALENALRAERTHRAAVTLVAS